MKRLKRFGDKMRYKSESILSKSIFFQIFLLAIVAVSVALITTIILKCTQIMPMEWKELLTPKIFWNNLMRVIDQGAMGSDQGSWTFLIIMLSTTIIGLIIVSTLISIITEGYETKVEKIGRGRSAVVEKNHIVILGWSSKIFIIINELIVGYFLSQRKMKKRLCITILANKDKTEMEDAINDNCKNSPKAKIVCRSGDPIVLEKLKKLSLSYAKSIVILSSEKPNPDTFVFKTILATLQICQQDNSCITKNIVAEFNDLSNIDILNRQIIDTNKIKLVPINSKKFIAEIIAQTSVQNGLSRIYDELLKFNILDNEIYFIKASVLQIKENEFSFIDLLTKLQGACLIGYIDNNNKHFFVNPLINTKLSESKIHPDDELVLIARSKNEIKINKQKKYSENITSLRTEKTYIKLPLCQTVIFGYNEKLVNIINELENYVREGSRLIIVADLSANDLNVIKTYIQKKTDLKQKLEILEVKDNIVDKTVLDSLNIISFNNIILLNSLKLKVDNNSKRSVNEINLMEEMDALTMKSLLNIREYFEKNKIKKGYNFSIITEMAFSHNKDIIPYGDSNEFIISDEIISSTIAHSALNNNRGRIYFDILFSPSGSEIYLKDAFYFIKLNTESDFTKVIRSAIIYKEIAIGYVVNDVIHLNPPKEQRIIFQEGDKVITLAEDYTFL